MTSLIGSKLIFLSNLPTSPPGDKVRFVGCLSISSYDVDSGLLTLEHPYKGSKHRAKISIEHVRDNLRDLELKDGNWINVVGYMSSQGDGYTNIGATMLWEAGPVKIDEYERALETRLAATSSVGKK